MRPRLTGEKFRVGLALRRGRPPVRQFDAGDGKHNGFKSSSANFGKTPTLAPACCVRVRGGCGYDATSTTPSTGRCISSLAGKYLMATAKVRDFCAANCPRRRAKGGLPCVDHLNGFSEVRLKAFSKSRRRWGGGGGSAPFRRCGSGCSIPRRARRGLDGSSMDDRGARGVRMP